MNRARTPPLGRGGTHGGRTERYNGSYSVESRTIVQPRSSENTADRGTRPGKQPRPSWAVAPLGFLALASPLQAGGVSFLPLVLAAGIAAIHVPIYLLLLLAAAAAGPAGQTPRGRWDRRQYLAAANLHAGFSELGAVLFMVVWAALAPDGENLSALFGLAVLLGAPCIALATVRGLPDTGPHLLEVASKARWIVLPASGFLCRGVPFFEEAFTWLGLALLATPLLLIARFALDGVVWSARQVQGPVALPSKEPPDGSGG
ncbi:MAG: hypothetical protein HY816_14425 [Candidatus Wallbacteria bacterium]|nr:hypothetical protein [Candidatus Wallbacteria bacterium]